MYNRHGERGRKSSNLKGNWEVRGKEVKEKKKITKGGQKSTTYLLTSTLNILKLSFCFVFSWLSIVNPNYLKHEDINKISKTKPILRQARWNMAVVPALGNLHKEDCC